MKRFFKFILFNISFPLLILTFSTIEARGWKSVHLICKDTIPVIFNISEDLQIRFNETHLRVDSKFYALEIPRENITEIKLNHDLIEDHSYIPEPEIPDVKEDPGDNKDPDNSGEENEDPGDNRDPDNPDNPDNPGEENEDLGDNGDPDNPDNPGEENEDPDIPTGIMESETEEVTFENERIVFTLPTDVGIYSVDGLCRDIRKGCEEINVNSLPTGISILIFKGYTLKIEK